MPHIHEKIDFTVEVFIVHKNKVLLRIHDKHKIWLSIGGHIELDEDPVEAAFREAKEEVGLDIEIIGNLRPREKSDFDYRDLIPPRYLGRHKEKGIHEHIVFVYFAKCDTDLIAESKSEHERSETKWATLEELNTMRLVPNVHFYAMEALKELGK